jgi:Cof subfamily protein (haloacid dehalogenase superfamily)
VVEEGALAPVSRPRLVATDLDGTLVRSDGSVSPYTAGVLEAVEALGVPVVFVTGRPLRWTEVVFEHVGSHGLAIVSNGALVWDVARHEPRTVRTMDAAAALAVSEELRTAVPGTMFAVESLDGIDLEPGFMERAELPAGVRRAPLAELFDRPALKLLARHEELDPEEFWALAEEVVQGRLVVTWSSTTALLEISAPGVTKASTLEQVAAGLGVEAADVIAFGDMPNDLPMLTWAGTSYAMADAHPSVVAAADHVAPGHDDDGVAQVLAGVFDL